MTQVVNHQTKFFHFSQNNSGGSFDFKRNLISHHVIIEARDAREANRLAEYIGIYFDGCDKDLDCSCCGDRWRPASGAGDSVPLIYDTHPAEYKDIWFSDRPHTYVHFLDGTVKGYLNPQKS